MESLIVFLIFVFGSIVGSFLNVVILRYNTGRSIVRDRSACFSCAKRLGWHNMVPIFSFVFQGGKCSSCFSKISWQYPVVEFLTAVMFVLLYLKLGLGFSLLYYAAIFSILIIITVYDIRHKIIHDGVVYLLILLALSRLLYIDSLISPAAAVSGFAGGILMFLIFGSLWFFSGGRWMGFGDAKLVLGLGWLNTACYGFTALVYSFWLGAAVGILINLLFKRMREVPFAPFLIAGFAVVFFSGSNLFSYLGETICLVL